MAHTGVVYTLCFSRDGTILASGKNYIPVYIGRPWSGPMVTVWEIDSIHSPDATLSFSAPDDTALVSDEFCHSVRNWQHSLILWHTASFSAPDSTALVPDEHSVTVWEIDSIHSWQHYHFLHLTVLPWYQMNSVTVWEIDNIHSFYGTQYHFLHLTVLPWYQMNILSQCGKLTAFTHGTLSFSAPDSTALVSDEHSVTVWEIDSIHSPCGTQYHFLSWYQMSILSQCTETDCKPHL